MVTEITNPTTKDIVFSVPNIATLLGEKGNPPSLLPQKQVRRLIAVVLQETRS